MSSIPGILEFLATHWPQLVVGIAAGACLPLPLFLRSVRLLIEALLLLALLVLWADSDFGPVIVRATAFVRNLGTAYPTASLGALIGLVLPSLVWRQRQRRSLPSPGDGRLKAAAARRGPRVAAGVVLSFALLWVAIPATTRFAANSDRWNLPNGELLQKILMACQFAHSPTIAGDEEHLLCPTRLSSHDFSEVLKDAVVASEDKSFFTHGAIDLYSTIRALWHSVTGDKQGGSTITQQLARTLFLRREDTAERKILEAVLAERIFAVLTRDQILAAYMNVVPHARNMYGFDGPARYYFGVGVQDLDLAEAALLVGMVPNPNGRDPVKDPQEAFDSAVRGLQRLVTQRKITADQARQAQRELKQRIFYGHLRRGSQSYASVEYRPYRDQAIAEAAAARIELGNDYRLIIHMDPEFQLMVIDQTRSIAGDHQAAGFFLRPSGEVLAISGSSDYVGEWNRAVAMTRSIGSTGKLFPLIGAHELSISMKRQYPTSPIEAPNWPAEPNPRCVAAATVPLSFALAQSCNRPFAKLAIELGQRLSQIVGRFGIVPPASPALVPIGGIQISPSKLTQAYATLENNGKLPPIRYLIAALGPKGNVIGKPAAKDQPSMMSPATATAVLRDLRGPVLSGTAAAAKSVHALVYGKTGTSSRNEDALFVGLTRDFVGAFWIGYDLPATMPGAHGGGAPAKAFAKITDRYYVAMAQARFAQDQLEATGTESGGLLKPVIPRGQLVSFAAAFGALMMTIALLSDLFRVQRGAITPRAA